MGRINSTGSYLEIVNRIREINPTIALTTDIIVGFPGETEEEFQESLEFVDAIGFAGGHVFHYSAREGTPASRFPGQVEAAVRKTRSLVMRTHLTESGTNYRRGYLGTDLKVLWEKAVPNGEGKWWLSGLSDNYLRVKTINPSPLINEISIVHIEKLESESVTGRIIA
jgi:threonylcarbamoyladenosine tRNA methylthiotransferase MtaB